MKNKPEYLIFSQNFSKKKKKKKSDLLNILVFLE